MSFRKIDVKHHKRNNFEGYFKTVQKYNNNDGVYAVYCVGPAVCNI